MKSYPRVLVISHNVFSEQSGMGKTLANLLSCVPEENLAQMYFHAEIPTIHVCENYLRITDGDVLRSLLSRRTTPRIYGKRDIAERTSRARTDRGILEKIYQFSRRRTPLIYFLRNLMWTLGKWESPALWDWVHRFSPDVIFFASGDYAFAYQIACRVAEKCGIPIVLWCCDDFYFSQRHAKSQLGRWNHKNLMKWLRRVSKSTASVIVISDKMAREYKAIFRQPISVVRIAAPPETGLPASNSRTGIVYAGSLGVNRVVPLTQLGRVLRAAGIPGYEQIDVYSHDNHERTLAQLTRENGIRFHGAVSADQMTAILGHAKFLLHVEAFDEDAKARTRYSLSTKIGESLCSGACIIAFGPADISSMEYLAENRAAVFLRSADELPGAIQKLNEEASSYSQYVTNARRLANQCHNKALNDAEIVRLLRQAAGETQSNNQIREDIESTT